MGALVIDRADLAWSRARAQLALLAFTRLFLDRTTCLAAPSMWFFLIGSRFMLHASFPRSVSLTQLSFTLLTMTSSQRDLHPQACAHAGLLKKAHRQGDGLFRLRSELMTNTQIETARVFVFTGNSTVQGVTS